MADSRMTLMSSRRRSAAAGKCVGAGTATSSEAACCRFPARGAPPSGRRRACTHAQAFAQDGRASPESGPVGRVEAGRTGNGACRVGPPSPESTKGVGGPFFTPSETGIANATRRCADSTLSRHLCPPGRHPAGRSPRRVPALARMDNVATLDRFPFTPLCDGLNIMSARDTRNRFGACLNAARWEPVVVTRNERPVGVMIFIEEAVDTLRPGFLRGKDPGYDGRLFGNVSAALARVESGEAADRGHHGATGQLRERLRERKARQDGVRRGIFSPDKAPGDLEAVLTDDDRVAGPTTGDAVRADRVRDRGAADRPRADPNARPDPRSAGAHRAAPSVRRFCEGGDGGCRGAQHSSTRPARFPNNGHEQDPPQGVPPRGPQPKAPSRNASRALTISTPNCCARIGTTLSGSGPLLMARAGKIGR